MLEQREAADRKRCGSSVAQPTEEQAPGSGTAIAVGALIDGIPESIAIGLTVAATGGSGAPVVLIAGFSLANIPQGISSASGMRQAGRSRRDGPMCTTDAVPTRASAPGCGHPRERADTMSSVSLGPRRPRCGRGSPTGPADVLIPFGSLSEAAV
ncbi:hypothetical protein [Streptomyces sp. NPDC047315]|uniref:hypothetical protein n=1 Tax=Streptomyces sp. NPDC047315 TaxID=3155142 RepID=UPI0033D45C24